MRALPLCPSACLLRSCPILAAIYEGVGHRDAGRESHATKHRPYTLTVLMFCCAGYGDVSPNNCWLANFVITIQSVYALLLNAVVLGIVFARVSRPGRRLCLLDEDSCVVSGRNVG